MSIRIETFAKTDPEFLSIRPEFFPRRCRKKSIQSFLIQFEQRIGSSGERPSLLIFSSVKNANIIREYLMSTLHQAGEQSRFSRTTGAGEKKNSLCTDDARSMQEHQITL